MKLKSKFSMLPSLLLVSMFAVSSAYAEPAPNDVLLTMQATPEIIAKGQKTDAYSLAVSAYNWGYPLVRSERVIREYTKSENPKPKTSYRAPLNQIGWATALATSDALDMPTPNNDTFYMSAVVDLTEPYILNVPDTQDRYYVVNVFNMWQELEHYVGRRTTGTKAGKFALVPPNWKGELPKDVKRLDISTSKVWLWGRMRVEQGEEITPLLALQKQFTVKPLSGKASTKTTLAPLTNTGTDELSFLAELAEALKNTAVKPEDKALFGQFARIGLTEKGFDPSKLTAATREGLIQGLKDAPAVAISAIQGTNSTVRNGWNWVTGLDSFGYNYPLRATVAGPYLGGNGEREAMYPIRYTDSQNKILNGSNQYEVKLPSKPPVNAFWSLTMYDAKNKLLVPNELNRYKVGSDTKGLEVKSDGTIAITISNKKPQNVAAGNWLPAPSGDFYVILRLYQPSDEILSGKWQLPQLNKK